MAYKRVPKKIILTAAEILAAEKAKEAGMEVTDPGVVNSLINEKASLEHSLKVAEEEKLLLSAKLKSQTPQGLRLRLEECLKQFGITAAFEPLIELATERYPMDHPVEAARGQLVCTTDQRIKIWTEILQYQMPKLKAVEVSGQVDNSITVIVRRFGDDSVIERKIPVTEIASSVEVKQVKTENNATPGVVIKKFD